MAAGRQALADPEPDPARESFAPMPGEVIVVVDTRSRGAIARDHRAVSVLDQDELDALPARTAAEALGNLAGVRVQKSNHAGGSSYVRGLTGQQTLLLVDGFRLNTSIMRSGPNQYFNTIDGGALARVEVLRGAGSVLYGSDAIGGVISATTRSPDATGPAHARTASRVASAERSAAGRIDIDGAVDAVRYRLSGAARTFGNLRSAGPLARAEVPAYDGNEQLFTGYDEVAGDGKVVVLLGPGQLTAAGLALHQTDAPRTDKCDPGPPLDCRFFDEQFYELGYVRYQTDAGWLREVDVGAAVSRTHERRSRQREARDLLERERDRVVTVQATGRASLPTWRGPASAARLSFGADLFSDWLLSTADQTIVSTGQTSRSLRGKYLDGSTYLSMAGFGFAELILSQQVSATAGARLAAVRAQIAADPVTDAPGFSLWHVQPVISGSIRVELSPGVFAVGSVDQGFRAPNLDDLTAVGSEGPGFQLANPDLRAESSVTMEGGLQLRKRRAWVTGLAYTTFIEDFIGRKPTVCPVELTERCGEAPAVFQLVNATSAIVNGFELTGEVHLAGRVRVLASTTYSHGNRTKSSEPAGPREPLSKMPPLAGVIRVRFDLPTSIFVETFARWAAAQDRLSAADQADARIPPGGTPSYGAVDLAVGARLGQWGRASLVLENLTDSRYRVHGSGVDGAGFNVVLAVSGAVGR
jgi:outer membrane receptor protein involved in Fe transport